MSDLNGSITHHVAPGQPSFAEPTETGPLQMSRPIDRDFNHFVFTQPMEVDLPFYRPPVRNSTRVDLPGAYLVGDSNFQAADFGDGQAFQRTWSTIPASRTDPLGTYAFSFPGLMDPGLGSVVSITAMSPVEGKGDRGYIQTPIFTATGHPLIVGMNVNLSLQYATGKSLPSATVIAVTTNTFTTTPIRVLIDRGGITSPPATLGAFASGTATVITVGRTLPRTIPADSIALYDYALPGVTPGIATSEDFLAEESFAPVDMVGNLVNQLDSSSVPSAADYRQMLAVRGYLIVESAVRPYLGDILERRTVCVRAQ